MEKELLILVEELSLALGAIAMKESKLSNNCRCFIMKTLELTKQALDIICKK